MDSGELGELDMIAPAVLNLGAGKKIFGGCVNHDCRPRPGIDVVHDLNDYPWPWETNTFHKIVAHHVLEHLWDRLKTLEELWRIARPFATIDILVPDAAHPEMWKDPTHRSAWRLGTLDYFVEGHGFNFYTDARFELIVRHYDEERLWLYWVLLVIK